MAHTPTNLYFHLNHTASSETKPNKADPGIFKTSNNVMAVRNVTTTSELAESEHIVCLIMQLRVRRFEGSAPAYSMFTVFLRLNPPMTNGPTRRWLR